MMDDFHQGGIDHGHLILVDKIDVGFAFAINGNALWLAAEIDRGVGLAGSGIDIRLDRDQQARIAAGGEHAIAGGVEFDVIGIIGGFDASEHGIGGEVKDDDRSSAAVADEAAVDLGDDCDAVGALLPGYVSQGLAGLGIDDQRVGGARDEEALGCGVDCDQVIATGPSDRESLDHAVVGRSGEGRRTGEACDCGQEQD